MSGTVLAPGRLVCPNDCGVVAPNVARVAVGEGTATMHDCPAMAGLTVPLVPEGTRAEMRRHEREDYAGNDLVRRDGDGRAVMSVETVRDGGTDCTVYAPTAVRSLEDLA